MKCHVHENSERSFDSFTHGLRLRMIKFCRTSFTTNGGRSDGDWTFEGLSAIMFLVILSPGPKFETDRIKISVLLLMKIRKIHT